MTSRKFTLSRQVVGGSRVTAYDVSCELYLSFKRRVVWSPALHHNALHVADDRADHVFFVATLMRHLRQRQTGVLHYFDYAGVEPYHDIDNYRYLPTHYYTEQDLSLSDSIYEVYQACYDMQDACRQRSLLHPTTRRYDVIVLNITSDHIHQLSERDCARLKLIVEQGYRYHVPVIVTTDYVTETEATVVDLFQWAAFMGSNQNFAIQHYHHLDTGAYIPSRKVRGVIYNALKRRLDTIQSLTREPSAWKQQITQFQIEERATYKQFLEELEHDS